MYELVLEYLNSYANSCRLVYLKFPCLLMMPDYALYIRAGSLNSVICLHQTFIGDIAFYCFLGILQGFGVLIGKDLRF